ncbi:MAG: bifunctional metallophosphatase/5'-nucleotidase [Firmicutes bacterium]|nr:bifunctional metallophosphatase/5'-nucleotidase [Bacillota bacterium]
MKSKRNLLALLVVFTLLFAVGSGAWAAALSAATGTAVEMGNGVITPAVWSAAREYDWYTAFSTRTERLTGQPVTLHSDFTVKANAARLTVSNEGVRELDVAINGQRLNLNTFFHQGIGVSSFDISDLIKYGPNTIDIEARGKPGGAATVAVEAPALTARIISINDIHGKIDPLPKAAAYVRAAKAAGGNVYFVDAGDDFSGNPVSDLNKGRPVVEVLNAMGTDLLAVGNHNFDHGPEATQARRAESIFSWLSANIAVADPTATPIQPFEPYKIFTTDLGQKIAFIGLTETPPSTGAKNIVGLRFTDPLAAAEERINELREQVNLVVLVSHNGLDFDERMAQAITGADLIVGGHSHTYLSAPAVVNGIPIIQAGSDARYLSDLVVRQAGAVTVTGGAAGGAFTVATAGMTAEDPGARAIVDDWNARMAPILDARLGYTPAPLNRDDRYAMDVSVGNLITDAMRDYMDAQIALTNNGGIRASIPAGDITMRQVYTVLPFGNFVMKFNLTGDQIRQIIEYSWNRDNRHQVDLQTSGLTYTVYTRPDGSIDHLDLKVNGQPIDPGAIYSVAVADYIGTGGGGYPLPGMATPVDLSSDVDAIIVGEYVKKIGTLNYAATAGRIRIKTAPIPVAVNKLNFYNSSSLLADLNGALVPLTGQATVLVSAEPTAYQYERSSTAPKNFAKVNAGTPIPLAALQQVGGGQVVGLGAILVANGYRPSYQNPQWFTNLLDRLTGLFGTGISSTGTSSLAASGASGAAVLFDEGHGQYYNAARLSSIASFLGDRGYNVGFTGPNTPLTAARLEGVKALVITTPGSVGAYTGEELAVLQSFVTGGGSVILASQTDYNNNSNPVELNNIAAAIGAAIRFNSDEVRDSSPNIDGTAVYSPLTDEFNPGYPDLLKVR